MKTFLTYLFLILALSVSSSLLRAQGSWSIGPTLPWPFVGGSACTLDGKIYTCGCDAGSAIPYYYFQTNVFDPSTNTWSAGPSMDTGLAYGAACALNGKIYEIGESTTSERGTLTGPVDLEIFDLASNKWSLGPSLPTQRIDFTASVLNGKIYVIGGETEPDTAGYSESFPSSSVEIFDPSTNSWSEGPPMPTARSGLTSSVVNGKIYAIGGEAVTTITNTYYSGVEIFDNATNSWSTGTSLPTAIYGMGSGVINGKIYLIGGFAPATGLESTVYVFDPSTNSWDTAAPMPTPSEQLASSVLNGKIYAMGGYNGMFNSSAVQVFDPGSSGVQTSQNASSSIRLGTHPNPASTTTTIEFNLPETVPASIDIFNSLGQKMKSVFNQVQSAGSHSVTVDLSGLPDGIYYYRIQAGEQLETKSLSIEN